jgi:hypothetical protein
MFAPFSERTLEIGKSAWKAQLLSVIDTMYINITVTILDIIHRLVFYFKTQLNSTGLSVPHRKHITSPLGAQQVNAIYSGHYPSSCFYLKLSSTL